MNKSFLIFSILNAIVGCVAGTQLVILTNNYFYYIVNLIAGMTSGILLASLKTGEKK